MRFETILGLIERIFADWICLSEFPVYEWKLIDGEENFHCTDSRYNDSQIYLDTYEIQAFYGYMTLKLKLDRLQYLSD